MQRRDFINLSLLAGGGLILGLNYACSQKVVEGLTKGEEYLFSPFLKITDDGRIIIYAPVPEIGQGTRTSLPMILAEELDADWKHIHIEQAVSSNEFGNMTAAGSTSVQRFYTPLRKAGAMAREMLLLAASQKWQVEKEKLKTENSFVININTGDRLSFFELAELASSLPLPENIDLKDPSEFKIIGQAKRSYDLLAIVTGKAEYGVDVQLPGMKYAAIERCPVRGGKLLTYDAKKAWDVDGILNIFEIKHFAPIPYAEVQPGVVVIAENTSAAFEAKRRLIIEWDLGETVNENDLYYKNQFNNLKFEPPAVELRNEKTLLTNGEMDSTLDFNYEIPFWAHYCMEPMNFSAHYQPTQCLLKGPNQRPQLIQDLVSQIYKIPLEQVRVETTLSGGGYGRRLAVDYAIEAIMVSKEAGFPVKVMWTRKDDVLHDYFRSISFHHFKIGLKNNKIYSWFHHLMTKPIGEGAVYEVQGAADLPYQIPNINIGYSPLSTGIQIGSWRSVAHSYNSFVVNNTITEVAARLKKDPLDFYLELMDEEEEVTVKLPFRGYRGNVICNINRLRNVLLKAAELGEWSKKRNEDSAVGLSCIFFKDSYAAHVVEVEKVEENVKLKKITAVLDCGQVINPLGVKAQMEGAISDAITYTLKSKITINHGRPQETNFDTHPVTKMIDVPDLTLHVMKSDLPPSGAGEPPFPSLPPAIANAVFRLTGERIRTLPIKI